MKRAPTTSRTSVSVTGSRISNCGSGDDIKVVIADSKSRDYSRASKQPPRRRDLRDTLEWIGPRMGANRPMAPRPIVVPLIVTAGKVRAISASYPPEREVAGSWAMTLCSKIFFRRPRFTPGFNTSKRVAVPARQCTEDSGFGLRLCVPNSHHLRFRLPPRLESPATRN
jgi:hypothetical protein